MTQQWVTNQQDISIEYVENTWKKREMADWDDIVNNRITIGYARVLCFALNAAKRRREEGIEEWRPGVNPF